MARCRHRRSSEVAISSNRLLTLPRVFGVLVVVVALVAALVVLLGATAPSRSCAGTVRSSATSGGLLSTVTTRAGATLTTLAPSHDNDAGRSRIPDATPDADNDSGRARQVCVSH